MPELNLPGEEPPAAEVADPPAPAPRPAGVRGRPPFMPTKADRQMVTVFRSVGVPPPDIAAQLGIDLKTLRKHFEVEMAHGLAAIRARMGAKVVQKALAGDGAMLKFYLTNWGGDGWRKATKMEHSGPDGTPLAPPNLIVSFMPAPDDDSP